MQLSNEEIANLSDAVQKTGNRDAHRNGWVWSQNTGKSEGYEKWNKENKQGTNSDGKETGTQINDLDKKEEINIQPEHNEETRIQKNEEKLRNLRDNMKHYNIRIIRDARRRGRARSWKLIWKNYEELPQSGKGNGLPGSPGNLESPKEVGSKEAHTKAHHHYVTQN